jgi:hypothetical protein
VKNQSYGFEIEDIIKQFVTAFNEVVINRYTKDRVIDGAIKVNYKYGPKQRILNDIVNKSQNLNLPVIAINQTGISLDKDRISNKTDSLIFSSSPSLSAGSYNSEKIYMPTPADISISMSIIANSQRDMDQIISNFFPYCNPYIVISTKIPSSQNLSENYEIRSKVIWSGDINNSYPTELTASTKYHITADTSFTVKGWIFKEILNSEGKIKNIFVIDQCFIPVEGFNYE